MISLNRKYPRSYKPEEFHDIVKSLDNTFAILFMDMRNEYADAISLARQIDGSIDFLNELRIDEQDTRAILSEISQKSRELQAIHDKIIAENYNLRNEQAILMELRKSRGDKITRLLSGGSPIDEVSQEIFGKSFGDLYDSLAPKDTAETLKAIIESEKQKREEELRNKNGGTES